MVYFFLSKFKFRRLIWFNPTSVAPISLKTHHVKFFPLRSSSIFNNQPLKKPLLLQPLRASFRFFRGCNFCPATRWISLTIAKTFTPRVERKSQKSREKPFYHRCRRWPVARQTTMKGEFCKRYRRRIVFSTWISSHQMIESLTNEMVRIFLPKRFEALLFFSRKFFFVAVDIFTDEKY